MSVHRPFERQLLAAWPLERWSGMRVLVAVSGGPDSVATLRALHSLGGPQSQLVAAHFDHRLRGPTAEADGQFVAELCRSLGIKCVLGRAPDDHDPNATGQSLEEAARNARYRFLTSTAEQLGARYTVTGHTADDQAETILHHIVRGTGLRGLAGMRFARSLSPAVTLVRPALNVTRLEVLEYLKTLDQPFRQDETNSDPAMLRNRIRLELMPLLAREYSDSIVDSLRRLGTLAGDAQRVIDTLGESLVDASLVKCDPQTIVIDCEKLRSADPHLVREALIAAWRRQGWPQQSMGQAQWNLLAEMARSIEPDTVPTQVLPGAIAARRDGDRLVITAST